VLAPALGKAASATNRFLNQMQDGTGAGGKFADAMKATGHALTVAWSTSVTAVRGFIRRNRADIESVQLKGMVQAVRGLVRIVTGIINGDWRQAWTGLKDIVKGMLRALTAVIRGVAPLLKDALVKLGGVMIKGLVAGLKALPGAIKDAVVAGVKGGLGLAKGAITGLIGSINPFGDGIGKLAKSIGDGVGGTLAMPGGSANLMGADSDLLPFASIAAGMGLHTSSGLRVGAITSSGNVSYHSSGDAIDEAGPPSAMMRFFKTMKNTFGPRLRELIYTPGGVGIKDGRPFRYTGQVAADHFDHVHVAYTGPFGDGIGQAVQAARAAGFRGQALINAVAVAGAESRYDAQAQNLRIRITRSGCGRSTSSRITAGTGPIARCGTRSRTRGRRGRSAVMAGTGRRGRHGRPRLPDIWLGRAPLCRARAAAVLTAAAVRVGSRSRRTSPLGARAFSLAPGMRGILPPPRCSRLRLARRTTCPG
jgi:hypothetical protein